MKIQVNEAAAGTKFAAPFLRQRSFRVGAAAFFAGFGIVWKFGSQHRSPPLTVRGEPQNNSVAHDRTGEIGMEGNGATPTALAPGNYTRDTLPSPEPEVMRLWDEIQQEAEAFRRLRVSGGEPLDDATGEPSCKIVPLDRGVTAIQPADDGVPAIKIA